MDKRRPTIAALLLLTAVAVGPAGALDRRNVFFTGEGNLYYREATGILPGIGALVLDTLVFLSRISDEEEGRYASSSCYLEDQDPELVSIPVEAYQFGGSAGFFVSPGIALGWRFMVQRNDRRESLRSFWGGGPELSCFVGSPWSVVRPFASVGALYTRSESNGRRQVADRPALLLRGGVNFMGPEGGIFLQTSYQTAPFAPDRHAAPTISRWGVGMGFIVFAD
jgi:hypothetical protein